MPSLREEVMCDFFTKFHIDGLPRAAVLHHFTDIDRGDPHDHPFGFTSFVISGGYTEEVFNPDGSSRHVNRFVGDSFAVPATHIHRIIHMPATGCWTLILPGPWERVSRFWQFRADGAWSRAWNEDHWTKMERTPS